MISPGLLICTKFSHTLCFGGIGRGVRGQDWRDLPGFSLLRCMEKGVAVAKVLVCSWRGIAMAYPSQG
jgi:hypothetical protein